MNNLVLNIGLKTSTNNTYLENQLIETKKYLGKLFEFSFKISEGSWENQIEKVFICDINAGSIKLHALQILLSNLCIDLDQDAIAFKLNNEGFIAFNPLYYGEKVSFNNELFHEF